MQRASLHVEFQAASRSVLSLPRYLSLAAKRMQPFVRSRAKSEEGTFPRRIIFVLGAEQGVHVSANLAGWVVSGQKS